MADENGYLEMQEEELQALQAIYMDDFILHTEPQVYYPKILCQDISSVI